LLLGPWGRRGSRRPCRVQQPCCRHSLRQPVLGVQQRHAQAARLEVDEVRGDHRQALGEDLVEDKDRLVAQRLLTITGAALAD